jgi:FdhE protein
VSVLTRFEDDVVVAPLARLHAVVDGTSPGVWDAAVPEMDASRLADGLPLLHGVTLTVDAQRARELLVALARALPEEAGIRAGEIDPLTLLEASICQDTARMADIADEAGAVLEPLMVLGQLAAQPLLRACGRKAAALTEGTSWDAGYCPVCAAWPVLAERRGLERLRYLRCVRCAAQWRYYLQRCPYCGNRDPKTLGYLAPEAQREARQVAICDSCQGYVKSVAALSALAPDELVAMDLTTLELDVAALDHGYARPEERGFPLEVSVIHGGR